MEVDKAPVSGDIFLVHFLLELNGSDFHALCRWMPYFFVILAPATV